MDIFATLIVTADKQANAQAIGPGMFTTPIGSGGKVTHYISSGYLPAELLESLQGIADCYDNEAVEVLDDMGLKLVTAV